MHDVRVGPETVFGRVDHGLDLASCSSREPHTPSRLVTRAAQFCIDEAVAYANARITWGKKLSANQASSSRSSSCTRKQRCCANSFVTPRG